MTDSIHDLAQFVGSASTMQQCASMVKDESTAAYMATMDNPFHPNSTDGDYNCYAITEGSSNNKILIPDPKYQSCFLKGKGTFFGYPGMHFFSFKFLSR